MGNRLRELRLRRGWTQEEAAEAFGMSKGGYLKLERGERRLTSDYIVRAGAIYGVPESDVITPENERDEIWPIWDRLTPPQRKRAIRVLKALAEEEDGKNEAA